MTPPRPPTPALAETSSHSIEVVALGVLRKDLSDAALTTGGRANRWPGLHDPRREPAVYRELLSPHGIGPRCLASGSDWIEIEQLDAVPLWQIGDAAVWVEVAAWVGRMHRRIGRLVAGGAVGDGRLLDYQAVVLEHWVRRAERARLAPELLAAHRRAVGRLGEQPVTFVHGDLYASNVLVATVPAGGATPTRPAVFPIDWELSGTGPGQLDLAALTSGGGLSGDLVERMVAAYGDAAGVVDGAGWQRGLDAARLQICVQWLSCAADWQPPEAQRHTWSAEAHRWARRC